MTSPEPLTLLILATDLGGNSIGRVHVLWELANQLDWSVRVVAPRGEEMWAPLKGTAFEDDCELVPLGSRGAARIHELATRSDLIVAAKPLPGALDRALQASRSAGRPLLVDIDDPDLESRTGMGRVSHAVIKSVIRPRWFWPALNMRRKVRGLPAIVSNPVLQRRWGGVIVPHARADSGSGRPHSTTHPKVVFVGTNRRHKGVDTIRQAVGALQGYGVGLIVTADPPADAHPWEEWVGRTTLEEGRRIVREGDIVILPSDRRSTVSESQLPAKLVDAMVAARLVIVADLEPLTWATGQSGVVLDGDSPCDIATAIRAFLDPHLRTERGSVLRERALSNFTITAVAPAFEAACRAAINNSKSQSLGGEYHR